MVVRVVCVCVVCVCVCVCVVCVCVCVLCVCVCCVCACVHACVCVCVCVLIDIYIYKHTCKIYLQGVAVPANHYRNSRLSIRQMTPSFFPCLFFFFLVRNFSRREIGKLGFRVE